MHPGVGVGWGWGGEGFTPYNDLYREGPPKRSTILGFNERVDIIFTTVVEV